MANMENLPVWMSRLQMTNDITVPRIRALFYGPLGSGKTHLSLLFPNPLVLDFDQGLTTAKKLSRSIPSIPFFAPTTSRDRTKFYDELTAILDMAIKRQGPFQTGGAFASIETIILDGYTSMADTFLKEIMISSGKDAKMIGSKAGYDEWGALGARLDSITTLSKQLPQSGYHLIGTCGVRQDKDETTGAYIGMADIVGGYRNDIGYQFDEVWYFEPKKSRDTDSGIDYQIHTVRYRNFDAKTRLGLPPTMTNITFEGDILPHLEAK